MEIDSEDRPERFQVLRIEGPDTLLAEEVGMPGLPIDWAENVALTRNLGDRWLTEMRSPLLKVPSVLVPETWNVLVNVRHPEATLLKITMSYKQAFDARLF